MRYRSDGRHVEANLTKQVLAEIEPGGHVRAIYTTSSGKPSTPTVIGRFTVYSKTPGTNSEGMVDSNYFIRGYAIHGYAEVPTYAASHGCLRVPIPDAAGDLRLGADGHAGRCLQPGRRREPQGQQPRRTVIKGEAAGRRKSTRHTLDANARRAEIAQAQAEDEQREHVLTPWITHWLLEPETTA